MKLTAPQTLRSGDVRDDGYIYIWTKSNGQPQWLSPDAFRRSRINTALCNAKKRARRDGVACEVSTDYLLSIFPTDNRCPALGLTLQWGGIDSNTSPSLDRIVPELGYVPGNVQWLSNKANRIKSNATTAEICAVADYLKRQVN